MVLHEIGQTERSGAADARRAVHQHGPSLAPHAVDLIGHAVEVQGDGRVGHVGQRDLHVLHVRPVEVGELDGGVDHAGDAFGQQQAAIGRHVPPAQEEVGGDLRDAPQQAPVLVQQPRDGGGNHGAAVVLLLLVEVTMAAGTHRGIECWSKENTSGNTNLQELRAIVEQPESSCKHKQISPQSDIFLFHSGEMGQTQRVPAAVLFDAGTREKMMPKPNQGPKPL